MRECMQGLEPCLVPRWSSVNVSGHCTITSLIQILIHSCSLPASVDRTCLQLQPGCSLLIFAMGFNFQLQSFLLTPVSFQMPPLSILIDCPWIGVACANMFGFKWPWLLLRQEPHSENCVILSQKVGWALKPDILSLNLSFTSQDLRKSSPRSRHSTVISGLSRTVRLYMLKSLFLR